MRLDKFSNPIFNDSDVFAAIYNGNLSDLPNLIVDNSDEITALEKIAEIDFIKYDAALDCLSVEEFDRSLQSSWFMPAKYLSLNIKQWVLDQCQTDAELNRVTAEFTEFESRNLIPVLQWLKYFVDTCREHNVLWGAGRGSSVASFVLFKIGVHKINSLKYQLDWKEFLRPDED